MLHLENDDDNDKDHEEVEELDDEELNQLIARNQEEIEIYKQMDIQRHHTFTAEWKEFRGTKCPSRLMTDDEVPASYMVDLNESEPIKETLTLGRGGRKKTVVVYDGTSLLAS